MSNKLTLTIVIPAFNEEDYLQACLEAIARQTDKPDEVIVVDNNSSDSTARVAKKFGFVRFLGEPKQGAVHARNRGFNAARGDIIARIDADTLLPAGWVSSVKQEFESSVADAVTGPVRGYDLPLPSLNWLPHHVLCLVLSKLPPTHPFLFGFNNAVRRSVWRQVKTNLCSDKFMHEDLDLAIHLHRAGYRIKYSGGLLAAASGRRYNDTWRQFHFYMKTYARTFRRHGLNGWQVYAAIASYYLGYFVYRPWTFRRRARKNPMGV